MISREPEVNLKQAVDDDQTVSSLKTGTMMEMRGSEPQTKTATEEHSQDSHRKHRRTQLKIAARKTQKNTAKIATENTENTVQDSQKNTERHSPRQPEERKRKTTAGRAKPADYNGVAHNETSMSGLRPKFNSMPTPPPAAFR
jgi:hypothetical protein